MTSKIDYEQMSGPPLQVSQRPEWVRVGDVPGLFGISRSKVYELIADRRIVSFCLRERGKIRGRRLVSYDSLHNFMEAQAQAQQKQAEATPPASQPRDRHPTNNISEPRNKAGVEKPQSMHPSEPRYC